MYTFIKSFIRLSFVWGALFSQAIFASSGQISIPFEKFQLDNGLTVIVHEDHKAPIVAVNIWYHVGAKDEPIGKTGFAHLYEHLMFNGTENFDDEYFIPFRKVGATDMNGTTNSDRTNYFANVPSTAVDMALWMESDRMGHLLGAITQEKLDNQRGVVQNEKREGENAPYGRAFNIIGEHAYPSDHPYSRSVIGSMEDLNAASLDDVKQWFKDYYGPNNAVIALAGDITVAKAKELVQKYFAHIPASDPLIKKKAWVAKRSGEKRIVVQDRVPQERIYMVWNIPEYGNAVANQLDVVASVLGGGKNSRLYKRLVYQDQIATSARAYTYLRELGGIFGIRVDVKAGVQRGRVEKAINEELNKLLRDKIKKEEMVRTKVTYRGDIIRGLERVGGFGGKSDMLIIGQIYMGDPAYYKKWLKEIDEITVENAHKAAVNWLSDGKLVVEYEPYEKYAHHSSQVDRKKGVPEITEMPSLAFPDIQKDTLSNGLKVVLAERHEIPTVAIELMVDAGYAADQGGKLGASSFALSMLDEGTKRLTALEISRKLESLGASVDTGASLDSTRVILDSLTENLSESIELFGDICLSPSFPQKEIDRIKGQWLAQIKQEKARPSSMAYRIAPPLIYGEGHAYAIPFTGSGTEKSVKAITRDDLVRFHKDWFRPDNATLIVVGDTTLAEIKPLLEKTFGAWDVPASAIPTKNIAQVELPDKARVFLIDKPDAVQSQIIAAQVAPPEKVSERYAIKRMNDIVGGNFTARLNMNLREDKGWAYGAWSAIFPARGQSPFIVMAPVQTDKTVDSMHEILKEYRAYLGSSPATSEELRVSIDNEIRELPGRYETASAVMGRIDYILRFDQPDDYVQNYKKNVEAVTLDQVHQVARSVVKPDQFTWVIVGDLSKIEKDIRAMNIGEVAVLDNEGVKIR